MILLAWHEICAVARFAVGSMAYRPKAIYALRFLRGKHCCCTCSRLLQLQWYSEPEFGDFGGSALRFTPLTLQVAWHFHCWLDWSATGHRASIWWLPGEQTLVDWLLRFLVLALQRGVGAEVSFSRCCQKEFKTFCCFNPGFTNSPFWRHVRRQGLWWWRFLV